MIRLLAPQFLPALLLVAIPILIHLFNFRRYRKAVFTNVRFLTELKEETTRMSRLKHLLILATRILAVIFLVMAFAQPVIPVSNALAPVNQNAVSIYLDNSFSMESQSREGSLFEVARRKAKEIAASFPPTTRIQLLTNDFEAVHQRLYSQEEFIDEAERIKISPASRKLSEVVKRQSEALKSVNEINGSRYLISDFQESFADFENVAADSNSALNLIALPLQSAANIFIDSCWLASPVVQLNKPNELFVRIVNSGTKDAENIPVRLKLNGAQRAVASAALAAGQSTDVILTFSVTEAGWQQVSVDITDHPVTFDDQYYLSFNVREKISILSLDGTNTGPYLKALYGQDPFFNLVTVPSGQVNYSVFNGQDVIILNQLQDISSGLISELQRFLRQGGTVICFPDTVINLLAYSEFLATLGGDNISGLTRGNDKVVQVELRHPVFQEVFEKTRSGDANIDYPVVSAHYTLGNSGRTNRRTLVRLQGGDPFLAEYASGRGTLYFFTVPLSPGFSNLARHALVVPMLYRMTLLSMHAPLIAYTLGGNEPVLLESTSIQSDETFHLKNEALKTDVIPVKRNTSAGIEIIPGPSVQTAGNYELHGTAGLQAVIALNYDREESPMKFLQDDEMETAMALAKGTRVRLFDAGLPDLARTINRENEGIALWKYCLLAVLIFLLTEILLLRYWKTA